jgi:hypothetical protein
MEDVLRIVTLTQGGVMARQVVFLILLLTTFFLLYSPALPCSLCSGQRSKTLREDAALAKMILCGRLANPRISQDKDGVATGGTTELHIEVVLKSDPFLGNRAVVELPRYVPCDPKNPTKFVVFCDIFNGRLDPYRGIPIQSAEFLDYLKGAIALDARDQTQSLLYFFNYLDHNDSTIADDAFLEFAKANDREIGQLAGRLDARKLRAWVQNRQTPPPRLNLYGFLLGACGDVSDAGLLRSLIVNADENTQAALSGLLSGYICLRPREGWELALKLLEDAHQPFSRRLAVLGTMRFYHGWQPAQSREAILRCLAAVVAQPDMADLAVEDLRRWQLWDLTREALAQFGKKSHSAPIMRRAIVRYALCCPDQDAKDFISALRKQDAELVAEVEESLQFERQR